MKNYVHLTVETFYLLTKEEEFKIITECRIFRMHEHGLDILFDADIEPHQFFSQESPDSAEAESMFVKYFFLQIPMENPGLN